MSSGLKTSNIKQSPQPVHQVSHIFIGVFGTLKRDDKKCQATNSTTKLKCHKPPRL